MSSGSVFTPVEYKEKVDTNAYEKAKFKLEMNDGTTKDIRVPIFTADKGVEGLLYVHDMFVEEMINECNFDAADTWQYWPKVLHTVDRRKWTNRVRNIPEEERTMPRFQQEWQAFLTDYANSKNPRDDLLTYLDSDACKKPKNTSVNDHVSRVETLCLYANLLPGVQAELTEGAITLKILQSFPKTWQQQFNLANSGWSIATNGLRQRIVQYMTSFKAVQDDKDAGRKHTKDNNKRNANDAGGSATVRDPPKRRKKGGRVGARIRHPCHQHNGTHDWADCSQNPNSRNYYMNPNSPFHRGNNGGGRGGRGGRGGARFNNPTGRGGGRGQPNPGQYFQNFNAVEQQQYNAHAPPGNLNGQYMVQGPNAHNNNHVHWRN